VPLRTIGLILTLALLLTPLVADAQQPAKTPRIGLLRSGSPPGPFVEAFRQGLCDLGYAAGRNVSIEYRWAEGRDERPSA
jgi:putative tryptophan/tyrosine transport system substrate-binding protein